MILETHKYPNGMNVHVIANVRDGRKWIEGAQKAAVQLTVIYLKWELDVAKQKIKIQFKLEWETQHPIFPPFYLFWQKCTLQTRKHNQTYWVHEDDLIFYEFYQGDCT